MVMPQQVKDSLQIVEAFPNASNGEEIGMPDQPLLTSDAFLMLERFDT
jgi:hypothetical protein